MESSENNIKNQQDVVTEAQSGVDALELQACQAEVAQWKDKFTQLNADLANYRRRVEKDQAQWVSMAQVRVLTKLLSIVDNFERALAEKPKTEVENVQAWVAGISMIHTAFTKLLTEFHVKEINCTGNFDPEYHEALMHVASDVHKSGEIVAVLEKGYQMADTVLRPAKVSVAQ